MLSLFVRIISPIQFLFLKRFVILDFCMPIQRIHVDLPLCFRCTLNTHAQTNLVFSWKSSPKFNHRRIYSGFCPKPVAQHFFLSCFKYQFSAWKPYTRNGGGGGNRGVGTSRIPYLCIPPPALFRVSPVPE